MIHFVSEYIFSLAKPAALRQRFCQTGFERYVMAIERAKQAHIWDRDPDDWYVEPPECSDALFKVEDFSGVVWDPACGIGRIVKSARENGIHSFGTDIIDRSEECECEIDFLNDTPEFVFDHIVSNPPFRFAEEFALKSLSILKTGKMLALLLPLVWISGFSSKRQWLPESPLLRLLPISPRPSMPPGRVILEGIKPGNGTKDFAWFVWEKGYVGDATVAFLNIRSVKRQRQSSLRFEVEGVES